MILVDSHVAKSISKEALVAEIDQGEYSEKRKNMIDLDAFSNQCLICLTHFELFKSLYRIPC